MAAYAALLSLAQTTDLNENLQRFVLSTDCEENIRSFHDYAIFLLSFLEEFPEKAWRWEGKIRDVAQEIEDIIELFMWQKFQSRHKQIGLSKSTEFANQLKILKEKIGYIAGDIMDERPAYLSAAASSPTRSAPAGNNEVIGLDDDLMDIKNLLCGEPSHLQVIPIVGMGGIGKTTLARIAYDDPLIIDHFHIRAWLTVSQVYNPHEFKKTLYNIVKAMGLLEKQMTRKQIELLGSDKQIDECEMELEVFKSLKGRRYLIVMDDIWSPGVWDDVSKIFRDDGNGSRIMLTTRLLDMATYPRSSGPVCQMRFLNDNQGWELLNRNVFANSNFPPDLADVGKEIARRCAGLPLAIVLVAGVLSAVNKTRASWEEIAKKVDGKSEEILSLSYMHLPHHLRPCFLFIGGFPEDAEIHASRLIRLWVAGGFMKHQNGCIKSLEEKAEEYLEDLVKRNLVIVTKKKANGKIKSCKLHDMIRDLCIRKAMEEKFLHAMDGRVLPRGVINERPFLFIRKAMEEKFLHAMDERVLPRGVINKRSALRIRKAMEEKFLHDMDGRVLPRGVINERHVSLSHVGIDNVYGPTIRTILCFQFQSVSSQLTCWGYFRLLRILDAIYENHIEIPSEVLLQLLYLRYLAFTNSLKIQSTILSNLVNLQTLIIGPKLPQWKSKRKYVNTSSDLSLPLEIWQMPQLRHIVFINNSCWLPCPPVESNLPLVNLQTLFFVEDLVWNEKILQMIPNVKKLGLVYTFSNYSNLHLLKHLHQLEKLKVSGNVGFWKGQNPTFPSTLKKLTLRGGRFAFKDMAIVGSLPNLEVLKLQNDSTDGETWEITDEDFPNLKLLSIDGSRLRHWITQSRPFPRLNRLVLRRVRDLMEIPEGVGEISTLELIELDSALESLVESAMQIKVVQQSYGNFDLQVQVHDLKRYEFPTPASPPPRASPTDTQHHFFHEMRHMWS